MSLLSKTWKISCLLKAAQKYRIHYSVRSDLSISAHIRERGQRHSYAHVMMGDNHVHCRRWWLHHSCHIYFYHFFIRTWILLSIFVQVFLKIHIMCGCNNDSNKWDKSLIHQEQPWSLCCSKEAYHIRGRYSRHRALAQHQCNEILGEVGVWGLRPTAWSGKGMENAPGQSRDKMGTSSLLIKSKEIWLKGVTEP